MSEFDSARALSTLETEIARCAEGDRRRDA